MEPNCPDCRDARLKLETDGSWWCRRCGLMFTWWEEQLITVHEFLQLAN